MWVKVRTSLRTDTIVNRDDGRTQDQNIVPPLYFVIRDMHGPCASGRPAKPRETLKRQIIKQQKGRKEKGGNLSSCMANWLSADEVGMYVRKARQLVMKTDLYRLRAYLVLIMYKIMTW